MAENRNTINIKSDESGEIKVADEVVAIIAGLAATEVEGVSSMAGNITNEIVSRLGMKNLSKGIQIEIADNEFMVDELGIHHLVAFHPSLANLKRSTDHIQNHLLR